MPYQDSEKGVREFLTKNLQHYTHTEGDKFTPLERDGEWLVTFKNGGRAKVYLKGVDGNDPQGDFETDEEYENNPSHKPPPKPKTKKGQAMPGNSANKKIQELDKQYDALEEKFNKSKSRKEADDLERKMNALEQQIHKLMDSSKKGGAAKPKGKNPPTPNVKGPSKDPKHELVRKALQHKDHYDKLYDKYDAARGPKRDAALKALRKQQDISHKAHRALYPKHNSIRRAPDGVTDKQEDLFHKTLPGNMTGDGPDSHVKWWDSMTPEQQKEYIHEHPGTKQKASLDQRINAAFGAR